MTTTEAVAFLRSQGYRVSAPQAQRAPRRLAGRKHRDCIDHHRMDGYSAAVCVINGQDAAEVVGFARECLSIGASAGDVLTDSRMAQYGRVADAVAA